MTRAEEAALKVYPNVEQPVWDESYPKTLFVRHTERNAFIKGYGRAEKDLALTWEDIKNIDDWLSVIQTSDNLVGKELYEEVLRRFNEAKNNRQRK